MSFGFKDSDWVDPPAEHIDEDRECWKCVWSLENINDERLCLFRYLSLKKRRPSVYKAEQYITISKEPCEFYEE